MNEPLDHHFFRRAAPALERLLKHTRANLTLRIEASHAAQTASLQELLRRLERYGDRISIIVDERLRGLVSIDSSVFKLVPAGSAVYPLDRPANQDSHHAQASGTARKHGQAR